MGECDSTFLKSRTLRITDLDNYCYPPVRNLQCPFRKGIIYYSRGNTLFERNIHRFSKHEPRILSDKSVASYELLFFKLIPIETNRVLLMRLDGPRTNLPQYGRLVERSVSEECSDWEERSDSEEFSHSEERSDSGEFSGSEECSDSEEHSNSERPAHLELSIHEICHYRLGPALWTYRRDSDKPDLDELLMPLRWPTDILGNTFDKNCMGQMKLLAMIHEAGLLHFQNLGKDPGANFACSPDGRIFGVRLLDKEVIAMLHFSSADAGFDLVTQLPIPFTTPKFHIPSVPPAFSADGSKFAVAAKDGTVSVWDVRNKIPLMVKKPNPDVHDVYSLKFSSGTLGREVLAITEHQHFTFDAIRIRLIDSTSFEIEETLDFKLAPILRTPPERSNVLFDPDGDMMYAEQNGRLCEWKLRAREEGPDWWLGGG